MCCVVQNEVRQRSRSVRSIFVREMGKSDLKHLEALKRRLQELDAFVNDTECGDECGSWYEIFDYIFFSSGRKQAHEDMHINVLKGCSQAIAEDVY